MTFGRKSEIIISSIRTGNPASATSFALLLAPFLETNMPTVTTTVTSAAACGKTTTVTTTEASPDAANPDGVVAKTKNALAGWVSGKLNTLEGCREMATADCKWSFSNAKCFTNTNIIHDYNGPEGLYEWCQHVQDLDLGSPDNWAYAADENNETCLVTLPNAKFGVRSTGKYTEPDGDYVFVFYWPNGSTKLAGVHHNLPIGFNDCF